MIKNIIFDLGNVLLQFNPLEYVRTKVIDEGKIHQVHKEIFLSEEWLMLDRGVITEAEAIERIVARSAAHGDLIRLCMNNWYELLTPIDGTIEILKSVKAKGYKTLILSNFHMMAYECVTSKYDFFQYFEGGVISYKEKLLKPESQIYDKLVAQYGITPSETIFIDDTKANIDGASQLGFQTILFDNPVGLRKELVARRILDLE